MNEARLSIEAARQDYASLVGQVESEIIYSTNFETSPLLKLAILHDMDQRTNHYLDKRFAGDGQFRAYLHTRHKHLQQGINYLKDAEGQGGKLSYTDKFHIAKGGMETEYVVGTLAETGEPLAIKTLKPHQPEIIKQHFEHEQAVLVRLRARYGDNYPPNLVKLFAHGDEITVTERIPGGISLANMMSELKNGVPLKQQLKDRIGYFKNIVDGLAQLYAADFTYHADLKPENCILGSDNVVRLCDFSLVDEMSGKYIRLGETTNGSPRYMAPERCISFKVNGDPAIIDSRADVYALGIILHELLTLRQDPYDRNRLSNEDQQKPKMIFAAAFAQFIKDFNLVLLDDTGRAYEHEMLDQLSKNHGHRKLSYHGCPFISEPRILDQIDMIIHKAINPIPINRYQSPQEMFTDLIQVLGYDETEFDPTSQQGLDFSLLTVNNPSSEAETDAPDPNIRYVDQAIPRIVDADLDGQNWEGEWELAVDRLGLPLRGGPRNQMYLRKIK